MNIFFFSWLAGCFKQPEMYTSMNKSNSGPGTSCILVTKTSFSKKGTPLESRDFYLRCSIQDYFIKFCESKVTKEELIPLLNQGITVEMEVRNGEWDRCPNDPAYIQSRTGTYAIIQRLLSSK